MKKKTKQQYHCPECEGVDILVYEKTAWKLGADGDFDFYCHSVKLQDSDAEAVCHGKFCGWKGERRDLVTKVIEW